jgi:hypothetical protein
MAKEVLNDEFLISDKAIKLYPFLKSSQEKKLASLHYSLGIIFLENGKKKEAKKHFSIAVKHQPLAIKARFAYLNSLLYKNILYISKKIENKTHVRAQKK